MYVVILMDASGSMKRTDPNDYRKIAAQTIISLLPKDAKVSIVEFAEDARILCNWKKVSKREELFESINRVGNSGWYTDFKVALEKAYTLLKSVPKKSRRIVLFLTDGIIEPYPFRDEYFPLSKTFKKQTKGLDFSEQYAIYKKKFRERFGVIARRLIFQELIPRYIKDSIEIYSIGFSPESDMDFLKEISNETSLKSHEVHYFYADKAIDLVETFSNLLMYWQNYMLLLKEKGRIKPFEMKEVFVDEFLTDVKIIVVSENEFEFSVCSKDGKEEKCFEGLHRNLKIFPLVSSKPPDYWKYGFLSGSGEYSLLIIGRSLITLKVTGLKDKYVVGDTSLIKVYISFKGKNAKHLISPSSYIVFSLFKGQREIFTKKLDEKDDFYQINFVPINEGDFIAQFVLYAKDRAGREMLPRPTKFFSFKVKPAFYVEPDFVDFGKVKRGDTGVVKVVLKHKLPYSERIFIYGKVKKAQVELKREEKIPVLLSDTIFMKAGEVRNISLKVIPKKGGYWGEFEGDIYFVCEKGNSYKIKYRLYVPNIWVYIARFSGFIGILFILIFVLLIYFIWSRNPYPWGYLKYRCNGGQWEESDLRKLVGGFKRKFLGIGRNKIIITGEGGGGDVIVPSLPSDLKIVLIFERNKKVYIKNLSNKQFINVNVIKEGIFYELDYKKEINLEYNDKIEIEYAERKCEMVFKELPF